MSLASQNKSSTYTCKVLLFLSTRNPPQGNINFIHKHRPFINSLESCSRNFIPVTWIPLGPLKEIHQYSSSLVRVIWINMKPWNTMLNYLSRTTMASCKCWKATSHCLHNCKPKCFIKCRLQNDTRKKKRGNFSIMLQSLQIAERRPLGLYTCTKAPLVSAM